MNLRHGTLSIIILLYVLLSQTKILWATGQVVVQMRVPEISLGNRLPAQNKHDLCRYCKYTKWHKQTQYFLACKVSFMVVPGVWHWGLGKKWFPFCRNRDFLKNGTMLSIRRTGDGFHPRLLVNILVWWNRTSGNLEIRVPVLGNRLFCAWWLIHFCWDICQDLAASAVRSSLYKCLSRNYDSVCTKANLKSDFHITGQLM